MKHDMIILFLLATLLSSCSYSQKLENGFWLPKKYVDGVMRYKHNVDFIDLNKPIQTIHIEGNDISMQTCMGELTKIPDSAVSFSKEFNGYEIKYLTELLNLKYISPEPYKGKAFILSRLGQELLLRIIGEHTVDSVLFTRFIEGATITDPQAAIKSLLMAGKYRRVNGEGNTLENELSIHSSGKIGNSKDFVGYKLNRTNLPEAGGRRVFNIVELEAADGSKTDLAVEYQEGILRFYAFKMSSNNYHIVVADLVFAFEPI